MRVVCGENYIEVRALQEFFHYYKAKLGSLHLSNMECRASEMTVDDKNYYFVRTAKEDYSRCGGKPLEVWQETACLLIIGLNFYFFLTVRLPFPLSRLYRKISLTSCIHWNCHRTLKSLVTSSEIHPSAWSIAARSRTPGQSAWIWSLCPSPSKEQGWQSSYLHRADLQEIWSQALSSCILTWHVFCVNSETLMRVDDLDATVKMLLYTDETYTNAIVSSPVIELREKVGNVLIGGTRY